MVNPPFNDTDLETIRQWLNDPDGSDHLRMPVQPAESAALTADYIPGGPDVHDWSSVVLDRAVRVRPAPHTNDRLTGYQTCVAMAGPNVIAEGDYFLVATNLPVGEWNA